MLSSSGSEVAGYVHAATRDVLNVFRVQEHELEQVGGTAYLAWPEQNFTLNTVCAGILHVHVRCKDTVCRVYIQSGQVRFYPGRTQTHAVPTWGTLSARIHTVTKTEKLQGTSARDTSMIVDTILVIL